jgi:Acetyltransferase (GNAT) domain
MLVTALRPQTNRFLRALDAGLAEDLLAWQRAWEGAPRREVMAHPAYARLFARPCDRVVALHGDFGDGTILLPLLLRPLAAEPWAAPGEDSWDAITPYGYGGPFAWGTQPDEDAAFWEAASAWCEEERLVSTFLRLSVFTEQLARMPWQLEVRIQNVAIPLAGGVDAVWRRYDKVVRRWVHKAECAGLEVALHSDASGIDGFMPVYLHTMDRCDAESVFPRSFFEALAHHLAGQYVFAHVLLEGKVVSTELTLCSDDAIYSFLGGTLSSAFALGPNYLLKHRLACWAAERGLRHYVLGGGRSLRDSLLEYKRHFARHGELPFKVACVVNDAQAYAELAIRRSDAARRAGGTWIPQPGFFPAYRAPPAMDGS